MDIEVQKTWPIESENGICFYSSADIAAMKIQAILGRGKKKDFWDLHELLKHYSLQQITDWHIQKYPNQMRQSVFLTQ